MNAFFQQLDTDFARVLGEIPKPVLPKPLWPTKDVPDDRSNFTRDTESTGV
ncbi:hypothetical protein LVB77_14760 [Lysobacter sp. 5GHs7-4]|uniref:hypothetical protein n=1 Tax=Lysobacter sp. 5GHs7-4 TaxID=2904253 RepID=UPI001E361BB2|nr:hypothetical protein [Lysobacter sp. 5GHs7-4]UHQ21927.1 hypothetical protein LVB77_14760 [Lysobacter sp. 5GHs7-4]